MVAKASKSTGFRIVAPSRFGYLRSAFPHDGSPAHQADVLVELLDARAIERLPVDGGSAGTLAAAEFALRHPRRCSHLVLLLPAANLTGRDPVEFTVVQQAAVDLVLGSDVAFWALSTLAHDLFGTADTARRLADRIPGAMLKIWPEGGHIWLGHDGDVAREIAAFVAPPGWSPTALSP